MIAKPYIDPARWAAVQLFAMDVDGILTDGTVQVSSDGSESKHFSVLDGLGLRRVRDAGITVVWISGRPSGATTVRAAELKVVHVLQGRQDKLAALQEIAARLKFPPAQCVYMGDDDIDAPALGWAGIGATVPGAMPAAIAAAGYVTSRAPGHGAVREICDHLLAARAQAASA